MQIPEEWAKELDALVQKLHTHQLVRCAIRGQIVVTIARQLEQFEQISPEMLDELLRLNLESHPTFGQV